MSTTPQIKLTRVSENMTNKESVSVVQIFARCQAIENRDFDEKDDASVTEMMKRRLIEGRNVGIE